MTYRRGLWFEKYSKINKDCEKIGHTWKPKVLCTGNTRVSQRPFTVIHAPFYTIYPILHTRGLLVIPRTPRIEQTMVLVWGTIPQRSKSDLIPFWTSCRGLSALFTCKSRGTITSIPIPSNHIQMLQYLWASARHEGSGFVRRLSTKRLSASSRINAVLEIKPQRK